MGQEVNLRVYPLFGFNSVSDLHAALIGKGVRLSQTILHNWGRGVGGPTARTILAISDALELSAEEVNDFVRKSGAR